MGGGDDAKFPLRNSGWEGLALTQRIHLTARNSFANIPLLGRDLIPDTGIPE